MDLQRKQQNFTPAVAETGADPRNNRHFILASVVAVFCALPILVGPSWGQTGRAVIEQRFVEREQPLKHDAPSADESIRPFHINVPEDQLVDLRQRLAATRWPEAETVADGSQGVELATMRDLVRYWQSDYDWRKAEARLNALPQFVTTIDGLDIYFIQVKSRYPNALPLIITHGWPGSIFELLKAIGPLTDPTAYGGRAEDAFDVVIPSLPGFGFSDKPHDTSWNPDHIARAWDLLMKRLGYARYVAQGGDWGALISEVMGRQAPPGLLGIHTNYPATVPAEIAKAISGGDPAPPGLSADEKAAFDAISAFFAKLAGYRVIHLFADARMPIWGVSAILSNLLLVVFSRSGQRWFYLASLLMLILFVILYNLLSKPINRIQTEAAKTGERLDNGRELQASWDRVLLIRVPLLAVSLIAQCLVLLVASA